MRRWLIWACLVLLVTPVAADGLEEDTLGNMKCVEIVIEGVGNDEYSVGLRTGLLNDSVLVATKAKLPRLQIKQTCPDALYLNLNFNRTRTINEQLSGSYVGHLSLAVIRIATVEATGKSVPISVWHSGSILSGPNESGKKHVLDLIEELVGDFAAAYYKAGNE